MAFPANRNRAGPRERERCAHLANVAATHLTPQPHLSITSPLPLTLILKISPNPLPLTPWCLHSLDFIHSTASVVPSASSAVGDRQKGAFGRHRCEQRKGSPSHFSNPNGDTWSLTSSKAPPRMTGSVSLGGTMPISSEMSTSSMWFTWAISLSWKVGEFYK